MASIKFIPIFAIFLVAGFVAEGRFVLYRDEDAKDSEASQAVKDFLRDYNLPCGLFPTSFVTSFHCDRKNATFVMKLDHSCYTSLEDEVLWFDEEIKGKIAPSRIDDVSGIQTRMFLEVGPSYKKLSASAFKNPPQCTREEEVILEMV